MTTYEAISTDAEANHAFWTEQARMYLAMCRQHRVDFPRMAKSYRNAFRRCIRMRRDQEYLK